MKFLIYSLILCMALPSFGQEIIEVKENNVTLLIFDSPIESEFFGAKEYMRVEKKDNINKRILPLTYLKVKGVEKNANLIVITDDQEIHEFKLHYSNNPKKFKYDIVSKNTKVGSAADDNIKEVKPLVSHHSEGIATIESTTISPMTYTDDKIKHIEEYCRKTKGVKKKIFQTFAKSFNVKLTLRQVSYDRDELYFHLSLTNKGGLPYDIAKTFFETNPFAQQSTKSNIELIPLLVFEKPDRIPGNTTVDFIVVFEKFSLDGHKNLEINIAEKNGDRDLLLLIENTLINNPVKL